MDELKPIRTWLATRKGHWPDIAKRTGLSTKTLQRVANDVDYSVNMNTFRALRDEMAGDLLRAYTPSEA